MLEQNVLVQPECLKVFGLFPLNRKHTNDLGINEVRNISLLFKCQICLQIMKKPCYLPCSHRFCYQCAVQRFNKKKKCMVCETVFEQKASIVRDVGLQQFIDSAKPMLQSYLKQYKILQKNIYLSAIKKENLQSNITQIHRQDKEKQYNNSEEDLPCLKEVKSETFIHLTKKKTRSDKKMIEKVEKGDKGNKEEKIERVEKEHKIKKQVKRTRKNIDSQSQLQNPPLTQQQQKKQAIKQKRVYKKKKKAIQLIQIQSSNPIEEIQQIQYTQFMGKEMVKAVSFNQILQVNSLQSSRKVHSFIQQHHQQLKLQSTQKQKQKQQMVDQNTLSVQAESAVNTLKQQFGHKYIRKLVELSQFQVYFWINLQPNLTYFLTPDIGLTHLLINARSPLRHVQRIVSQALGIPPNNILLSVKSKEQQSRQLLPELSLLEVNQYWWGTWQGFILYGLSQRVQDHRPRDNYPIRTIYYAVSLRV